MIKSRLPVAVIGAGPYGLSIAAHLRHQGVEVRIFGQPMRNWRSRMPSGMFLKSEPFASSLSDPESAHTFELYCRQHGLPYSAIARPTPLSTFIEYATWFQERLVPEVDPTEVIHVGEDGGSFDLHLASGERVQARNVVVAVGFSYFSSLPPAIRDLPSSLASHTSDHSDLGKFNGRDVVVIGAGQSALETAALLHEHGARPRLLVRKPAVNWNAVPVPHPRSAMHRLRNPQSGLCDGWRCYFYSNAPMLFRYLPADVRLERVRVELGPGGAWWLRERVEDRVPVLCSHELTSAEPGDGHVRLRFMVNGTRQEELTAEHVIAGTGFSVDVDRISFLDRGLAARIRRVGAGPVLSGNFESSLPGLYFVGLSGANTFGPVLRFVYGTRFTARRVTRRIASQ